MKPIMGEKIIHLIRMKLDILKLKADNYNWQCHTPDDIKKQLEKVLSQIEAELSDSGF